MRNLTPTLTQSGLLAVLLQRQRYKVIQFAQRREHSKHMRAALWNVLTWPYRALTMSRLVGECALGVFSERLTVSCRANLRLGSTGAGLKSILTCSIS